MRLSDLEYEAPEASIAQRPAEHREDARLLVLPAGGTVRHERVADLPRHFGGGDVLVLNDTRVRRARLRASKRTGGLAEVLLVSRLPEGHRWTALVRASRSPAVGSELIFEGGAVARVLGRDGAAHVLECRADLDAVMEAHGRMPLPPYVRRPPDAGDDERYQTLHAGPGGDLGTAGASIAAPTAGLHLTPTLLRALREKGTTVVRVTLGVGLGTFEPIRSEDVARHPMHEEPLEVSREASRALDEALADGRRVTAVGTTALRALEAAATLSGRVRPVRGWTGLYLLPGSRFRVVSRLLTNFHQPRTTLLALVAAFAGRERILAAYREAVERGYRLFSYGDATLLERYP